MSDVLSIVALIIAVWAIVALYGGRPDTEPVAEWDAAHPLPKRIGAPIDPMVEAIEAGILHAHASLFNIERTMGGLRLTCVECAEMVGHVRAIGSLSVFNHDGWYHLWDHHSELVECGTEDNDGETCSMPAGHSDTRHDPWYRLSIDAVAAE